MDDHQAQLILSAIPGLSQAAVRRLLQVQSACDLLANPPADAPPALLDWRSLLDPDQLQQQMKDIGARFIPAADLPKGLADLGDAPLGLYARGRLDPIAHTSAVAIVGTRSPSDYGIKFARELGRQLAKRDILVVSGMALGIDAAAHAGALEADGPTAAILGTGVDVLYPSENKKLFGNIIAEGVALSEFPLGYPPDRSTFPRRNRIIAALAQLLVVVESDNQGGAMITATLAQKLGRKIAALPGRIDQAGSGGPHRLIQQGASLVAHIDDVLDVLYRTPVQPQMFAATTPRRRQKNTPVRIVELPAALQPLRYGESLDLDTLAQKSGMAIPALMPLVMQYELEGKIAKRLDGKYELVGQ